MMVKPACLLFGNAQWTRQHRESRCQPEVADGDNGNNPRTRRLLTQTETLDQRTIAVKVLAFEVVEQLTALTHHHQQTTA